MAAATDTFKIRLVSVLRDLGLNNLYDSREVIFDNTPTLSESGSVEYSPVAPVHLPGAIQIYKNTQSRNFSIGAKLISRTPEEAYNNLRKLQMLRSWRMPFFGIGSSTLNDSQRNLRRDAENVRQAQRARTGQSPADQLRDSGDKRQTADEATGSRLREQQSANMGAELLGAPPEVLYLYAYSGSPASSSEDNGLGYRQLRWVNLNKIPVVLTNLNIQYPDDVDYIPATRSTDLSNPEPCPVRIDVTVELVETHSPAEFEKFDLNAFKQGELVYW